MHLNLCWLKDHFDITASINETTCDLVGLAY
jgi:hypothetical protein